MGNRKIERYADLAAYIKARHIKKIEVAAALGVRPEVVSKLLRPEFYRPSINAELTDRIASLLNQTPEYVRRLYTIAA